MRFLQSLCIVPLLIAGVSSSCLQSPKDTPCGKLDHLLYNTTGVNQKTIAKAVESCLYSKDGPCSLDPIFGCLKGIKIAGYDIMISPSYLAKFDLSLVSKLNDKLSEALEKTSLNLTVLEEPLACVLRRFVDFGKRCDLGLEIVRWLYFRDQTKPSPWDTFYETSTTLLKAMGLVLRALSQSAFVLWPDYSSYNEPTKITLFAASELHVADPIIDLGGFPCQETKKLSEFIYRCTTPDLRMFTKNGGVYVGKPLPVTILDVEGNQTIETFSNFTFRNKYVITDIEPKVFLKSGGTVVTVIGNNLKSATNIQFSIATNRPDYPEFVRAACDGQNDTVAFCRLPPTEICEQEAEKETEANKTIDASSSKEEVIDTPCSFDVGGKTGEAICTLFPLIEMFEGVYEHDICVEKLVQIHPNDSEAKFPAVLANQIRLTIGGTPCTKVKVTLTKISCVPGMDPASVGEMDFRVHVGKTNEQFVGKIVYGAPNMKCKEMQVLVACITIIALLTIVVLSLVIHSCRRHYRRRGTRYKQISSGSGREDDITSPYLNPVMEDEEDLVTGEGVPTPIPPVPDDTHGRRGPWHHEEEEEEEEGEGEVEKEEEKEEKGEAEEEEKKEEEGVAYGARMEPGSGNSEGGEIASASHAFIDVEIQSLGYLQPVPIKPYYDHFGNLIKGLGGTSAFPFPRHVGLPNPMKQIKASSQISHDQRDMRPKSSLKRK